METHISTETGASVQSLLPEGEFPVGSSVIYGLHGRCSVTAIETRQISGKPIRFYKLEVQRSNLSRSNRVDPAIWLPVASASDKGLRAPVIKETSDAVFKILSSREYYFQINESWTSVYPKLDACIRLEGAIGLAKVFSYLFVLRKRQIVPSQEVARLSETVNKALFRELSDALAEPIRAIEDKTNRVIQQKLLSDS